MELFTYLLKSAAILGLFYVVYWFALRKHTLFIANRQYLIAGILAALILPFITYTQVIYIEAPEVSTAITANTNALIKSSNLEPVISNPINWPLLLIGLYGIGVLFCSLRFIYYCSALLGILKGHRLNKKDGFYFVTTKQQLAPFSFFKFLVFNPKMHSQAELDMIIKHEKAHASGWHSADVLLGHLLTIIHWINPIAWLYQKAIVQNLEYLADEHTVKHVPSKKAYQLALVKASTNGQHLKLSNSFYQSFIKNRIVMLNTNQTRKVNRWKLLLVIPLLAIFMYSFNVVETYAYLENSNLKTPTETSSFYIDKNSTSQDLDQIMTFFNTNYTDVTLEFSDKQWSNGELKAYALSINFPESQSGGGKLIDSNSDKDVTPRKIYYKEGPAIVVERFGDNNDILVVDYNGVTFYDRESDSDMDEFYQRTTAGSSSTIVTGEAASNASASTVSGTATTDNAAQEKDKTLYIINEKQWPANSLPQGKNIVTNGSITMLDAKEGLAKYGDAGKDGVFEINGYAQFVDKDSPQTDATALSTTANISGVVTTAKDITVVITSDMTREMINEKEQYLKDTHNIDLAISNIKYNGDNQITGITIKVKNKTNTSSYSVNDDEPIKDITLTINDDGSMSVSDAGSSVRGYARMQEMEARKAEMALRKAEMQAEMEARKAELAAMSDERRAEMKAQMEARKAEMALIQEEQQEEMKARMVALKLRQKEMAAMQAASASIAVSSNARSMASLNKNRAVLVTATTTDAELELLKEKLASKGVDFTYKKVKRNTQGEITSIKIALNDNNGSKSSAQIMGDNDQGIEDIFLQY